ncbi:hypothetical protein [Chitinophaga sp. ARDCPP14]|uniref:hypothetical protein n=1 Tax=Chitinophaga sp. ARDCPP14 TaxID=3391139 RepID=UPI003F526955
MKRQLLQTLCVMAIAIPLLLQSCLKPPVIIPGPNHYRIVQLKGIHGYDDLLDSVRISYNNKGNPVSLIATQVTTGYPQFLIGYDNKHTLKCIIGAYSDDLPFFEIAHKYITDNKGRVTTDSTFTIGIYDRSTMTVTSGYNTAVEYFSYDNKDRIVKSVRKQFPEEYYGITTVYYHYNAAGNAYKISTVNFWQGQTSPPIDVYPIYDDKLNPHQLHKIWMFNDRDYSVNNPFVADQYNNYGLPVSITAKETHQEFQFLNFNFKKLLIKYN